MLSPRNRTLRYSLRTLLVALTLLCCWLGWTTKTVRDRKQALAELQSLSGVNVVLAEEYALRFPAGGPAVRALAKVPLVRRWLGDRAVQEIWYSSYMSDQIKPQLDRTAKLFPEALVSSIPEEPCHPGCFPRGTLVDVPSGTIPIERLRPGDLVSTVTADGSTATAPVEQVFITRNRLWQVTTSAGSLLTTETQPLCLSLIAFAPPAELASGATILSHRAGQIQPVYVVAVTATSRAEPVFNLVLGPRKVFVAGGFLALSKPPSDDPPAPSAYLNGSNESPAP